MDADTRTRRLARAEATLGPPGCRAELLKWARVIARGVSDAFGFSRGSQEQKELEAFALAALWDRAGTFDPARVPPGGDFVGAFKGYAHPSLNFGCRQHADRLRNGGTYHTREYGLPPVVVDPLPRRRSDDGDGDEYIDVPDREPNTPDPSDEVGELAAELLDELRPAERLTLSLIHGLPPATCSHTHAEAARALGTTRARVKDIEAAALAKLREPVA